MSGPLQIKGIKCDNQACGFHDDSVDLSQYQDWLNKPCPKCGENLLTEADMKTVKMLVKIFNNPLMKGLHKIGKAAGSKMVSGKIDMDGTGKIDIKIDKDKK